MSISNDLGSSSDVPLPQGTISYRERGTGEPIVFVHGALVNADLWRKVVPRLARTSAASRRTCRSARTRGRCRPTPTSRPPALADADRRLHRGARPRERDAGRQRHRRRAVPAGRHAPPRAHRAPGADQLRRLRRLPARRSSSRCSGSRRIPGFVWAVAQPLRIGALRHSPIGFGWLAKKGIPKEITKSWLRSLLRGPRRASRHRQAAEGREARHTQGGRAAFRRVRQARAGRLGPGEGLLPGRVRRAAGAGLPAGPPGADRGLVDVRARGPARAAVRADQLVRARAGEAARVAQTAGACRPAALSLVALALGDRIRQRAPTRAGG